MLPVSIPVLFSMVLECPSSTANYCVLTFKTVIRMCLDKLYSQKLANCQIQHMYCSNFGVSLLTSALFTYFYPVARGVNGSNG